MFKNLKRKIKKKLILKNKPKYNNRFGLCGTSLYSDGTDAFENCELECGGENNVIELKGNVNLTHSKIFIQGKNNKIIIGKGCYIGDSVFWIEGDSNIIEFGSGVSVNSKNNFTCMEGTKIFIGEKCLFSLEINVQTSDGHNIFNEQGERINEPKDVTIGKNVWIGKRAAILKGASIADNSVVGAGAIVTKSFIKSGVVLAGVPAKVVKENITWRR